MCVPNEVIISPSSPLYHRPLGRCMYLFASTECTTRVVQGYLAHKGPPPEHYSTPICLYSRVTLVGFDINLRISKAVRTQVVGSQALRLWAWVNSSEDAYLRRLTGKSPGHLGRRERSCALFTCSKRNRADPDAQQPPRGCSGVLSIWFQSTIFSC